MPRWPYAACRCRSQRAAEELVAEADAEERDPRVQHLAQQRRPVRRRWPGRPGRWRRRRRPASMARTSSNVAVARQHVHLDAALGEPLRRHRLDAEVERGDGEPRSLRRSPVDDVRPRRRVTSPARSAPAIAAARRAPRPAARVAGRGGRVAGEDAGPHRAALAQVAGQRAGVDAADADDALRDQFVVEGAPERQFDGRGRGRGPRSRRPRSCGTRRPRRSPRCCRCAGRSCTTIWRW